MRIRLMKNENSILYSFKLTDEERHEYPEFRLYETATFTNAANFLYNLFGTHKNLYAMIGVIGYHAEDRDFDGEVCEGFRQFLEEVKIGEIRRAVEKKIQEIIKAAGTAIEIDLPEREAVKLDANQYTSMEEFYYDVRFKNLLTYPVKVRSIPTDIAVPSTPSLLYLKDGVYEVKFNRVMDENPIEGVKRKAYEMVKKQEELLKKKYDNMRDKIREEMAEELAETLEYISTNYKVKDGYIKLGDVKAKKILYNDKIYEIPEGEFYIKGLKVKIKKNIGSHDLRCWKHFHPNVEKKSNICIGTLEGKDLKTVIDNVINVMETVNLDSAFDNPAKEEAREIIEELCSEGTAVNDIVWRS